MNTCPTPHLEMSPKRFTVQLDSAVLCFRSEQIQRVLAVWDSEWVSDCSFTQGVFEYPPKWCTYSAV